MNIYDIKRKANELLVNHDKLFKVLLYIGIIQAIFSAVSTLFDGVVGGIVSLIIAILTLTLSHGAIVASLKTVNNMEESIDEKVKDNNINNKIDRLFYYVIKNEIENYKEFNIDEKNEFLKNIETLELNYSEEITKNMTEENKDKIKHILFFIADMIKHQKIIPINTYTRTIMILVYDKCKMKEREYKNTSNEIINFYEYYSKSLLRELFKI